MANSRHMQGMTLPLSTYNKLYELKETKGFDSWDSTIKKLIEMDLKYNFHKTIEYEFLTDDISKVFRIIFDNSEHKVEYYAGGNKFLDNISAWDSYPSISDEDKDLFIRFILNKSNIIRLKDLQFSENFGEFEIRKVG